MTTIKRKLVTFYLAKPRENLENTMWFRSAPNEAKERIELTLTAIDSRYFPSLLGSSKKMMCVVAEARDTVIGESIEILNCWRADQDDVQRGVEDADYPGCEQGDLLVSMIGYDSGAVFWVENWGQSK